MAKVLQPGELPKIQDSPTTGFFGAPNRRIVLAYFSGTINPSASGDTSLTALENRVDARPPSGQMWPRGNKHTG